MASQNKKRKGAIDLSDFDESLLIGSISDMPGKETEKASIPPAAAPVPTPGLDTAAFPVAAAETQAPAALPVLEVPPAATPTERGGAEGSDQDLAGEEPAGKKDDKKPKTAKSWEYSRFLIPTEGSKKSNIYISDLNHQKVKSLLSLLGRGVSITDYVENMFASHWEQYGAEIQKRINENNLFK
jgi:hypothetical protein